MIGRAPTEDELKQLQLVDRTRKQAVAVVFVLLFLLLPISRLSGHEAMRMFLAASAVVIMLATLVYVSFCMRCPRCSGWIAIPKCPACGLKLEKSANS